MLYLSTAPDRTTANACSGLAEDLIKVTKDGFPFEWTPAATGDAADSYNISLGTNIAGDDIGQIDGFDIGNSINYSWAPNTTYYWFIEAVNCAGVTASPVWSFTTSACTETAAPAAATTPSPANGASNVAVNVDGNRVFFSWTENATGANYTLNLDTENPPALNTFNDFENGGAITGLQLNTTYYWSIDAVNCFGTTEGPVWSFTTDASLSTNDVALETFSAYPNPTTGLLNIKSKTDVDNVTVYNLLGQSVASFNKNQIIDSTVNLSELSEGLYLVKITSGDKTQTLRVTKE